MKNAIIAFILMLILVFAGFTIYTVEEKTTRKNELDSNLGVAMEQSMSAYTIDPQDGEDTEEMKKQLISDFIQGFLVRTTSDSTFKVDVISADAEKGLLDVKVTETFPQVLPNSEGEVSVRKTILLDEYVNEENESFEVSFYVEDENGEKQIMKMITVHGGSSLSPVMVPTLPEKEGYTFTGWRSEETGAVYTAEEFSGLFATQPLNFVAVFAALN